MNDIRKQLSHTLGELKIEKNIGEKMLDLFFTVFELFAYQAFSFFLYFSINIITSPCKIFNFLSQNAGKPLEIERRF